MEDLISVIVPVYNKELSLEICVNSILMQTYKNLEIILIDDGSTDQSFEICKTLQLLDSRIVVYKKKNGGVSSARNLGIEKCCGNYICFVDADDTIMPNYIERLYNGIKSGKYLMSCCGVNRIRSSVSKSLDKHKNIFFVKENDQVVSDQKYFQYIFNQDDYGGGFCWNKMYDNRLIENLRFDTQISFGEDLLFVFHVLECLYNKEIYVCREGLYNHVWEETGLSTVRDDKSLYNECLICQNIFAYIEEKYPELKGLAGKRYLRTFSILLMNTKNKSQYKSDLVFAKSLLKYVFKLKEMDLLHKIVIWSKVYFPSIMKYITAD